MSQTTASAAPSRIDLIDVARGLALLAMFVFHFAYDLSYFGLIETDIPVDPSWRWFARCIAGSFLTIVGFSLVLATRKGLNRRAYFRRFAMVAGAAALVTLATRFAMPDSYIFFGILHQIALASLLALPFLRLPAPVVIISAAAVFAVPFFVVHPWLDHDWLLWLGLARVPIRTADFVPVFPWFGCVLAGMALAKIVLPLGGRWQNWQARILPARVLAWGGRHSLAVYLVHQPVFIGTLMLALQIMPVSAPQERSFVLTCQRSCADAGTELRVCTNVCDCAVEGLKQENLWSKALTDRLNSAETERTRAIARACYRDQQ
ncbi:heparan-alpha-glucosaminide N-acetyltransferase [Bosea sp. BK604]|uniref:heparan-alpha-glucosaminide N-acetyltransferase n=1 Tax=Bosea sp. BK604 TaxID=2512180 RepID=UPI00104348D1|nr:heparan-alpha-glucosaminide N-acetyltransferase [Bosea sp. BK604]TCR63703.1 putative membrane protein [Bosea sp. BK604]